MKQPPEDRLVSPSIERMPSYQPGRSIGDVRRAVGLEDVIKLASNECPLGPSPRAVEAMARALGGSHRYATDEDAEGLRAEIARSLSVTPDQVVLTAGITELLELAIHTFATPEEHAVLSAGSFMAYRLFLAAASVPFAEVPLGPDMAIDLPGLAAAVRPETKLIFLPNPNNPTGSRFGPAAFERFVAAIPDRIVLVLDDAYVDFQDAADVPDTVGVMRARPRTIVARGFSKAHGLAGIRLGYGVASPVVAGWLRKVHRPFSVSTLALAAGLAAFSDVDHVRRTVDVVREGRAFLTGALRELGLMVLPSHANFVTVDLGAQDQAAALVRDLLQRGVIVRPLVAFGLPNHVRISVGTDRENRRLVAAMRDIRQPPARR